MVQEVSMTKEQVQEEMKYFRRLFPIVRLLDGEKLLRRNDGMEAEPVETDAPEGCIVMICGNTRFPVSIVLHWRQSEAEKKSASWRLWRIISIR